MIPADLIPLSVAVPLVTATLLPLISQLGGKRLAIDALSLAAALATVVVDVMLLMACRRSPLAYWFGGWNPGGAFPVGIPFLAEPAAVGAALLAALLSCGGLLFSVRYFQAYGTFFHSLILIFLAAMSGFCLAADLFNQFVFFELMGVSAYALTAYKIEDTGPLEGGLNFAVMNSIGAISILMGIGLVYGRTGALTMTEVGRRLATGEADLLVVAAVALFFCGYFVKGALFPFHFWLPDAHAVAPTAASVLFSGVMVEIALLGMLRTERWVFSPVLGHHGEGVQSLVIGLGAVTALLGAVMALLQRHLKRLLAFSTVSHAGLMAAAAAMLNTKALGGTFVYLLGHGLAKGALFICAGILLHRKGSVDEIDLHGHGRDLGACGVLYFLAAAGLAGLPPFATFMGKALMEEGARGVGCHWFTWVAAAASALTAAAVVRAGGRIFLGWGNGDVVTETAPLSGSTESRETRGGRGRTPATMLVSAALLLLVSVAAGVLPGLSQTSQSVASMYLEPAGVEPLLIGNVPLALPEGEPFQVEAKAVRLAAAVAVAALLVAAGFLASPGKGPPLWRRLVLASAEPLRALHSGHVGDYGAWFTAGCGFLLIALAGVILL